MDAGLNDSVGELTDYIIVREDVRDSSEEDRSQGLTDEKIENFREKAFKKFSEVSQSTILYTETITERDETEKVYVLGRTGKGFVIQGLEDWGEGHHTGLLVTRRTHAWDNDPNCLRVLSRMEEAWNKKMSM